MFSGDSLQYHICLEVLFPNLDTVHQIRFCKCWINWKNYFLWLVCNPVVSLLFTFIATRAHCWLLFSLSPTITSDPFLSTEVYPVTPQLVFLHLTDSASIQKFALAFMEFHLIKFGPCIQFIKVIFILILMESKLNWSVSGLFNFKHHGEY